ncbi:tail fiber protein [Pseudosulfitobacter sp. SM2401]|uniref:phage tail protein n=1 Tax=Pseudosulfitobacter sp. SM2401 TaxID=3350098 RepID=UPI0036F301E5
MTKLKTLSLSGMAASAVLALGLSAAPQSAAAQIYTGEIFPVGFNFCPRTTAALDGQLLAISSNQALFSLLGTTYGGDGRTTFALPDMRGRTTMQHGNGPGLSTRLLGQRGGDTLLYANVNNLPAHSHPVGAVMQTGDKRGPGTDFYAIPSDDALTFTDGPADVAMDPAMIQPTGSSQPLQIAQPFLAVNWCISMYGVYPSRS